ncbi:MAG: hypothetical protein D6706_20100 [Chloroflexi bacterium]|nr:MAG: hypothetical protein D6706_20100 [Chloroflexota bacterium]
MHPNLKSTDNILAILFFIIAVFVTIILLVKFYPPGVDWEVTYSQLSLSDPYSVDSFMNPPFTVLFLPHAWLPLRIGNAINLLLNIVVIFYAVHKMGGGWIALGLVFTSPVFFDLCRTNNIDWLPLLGLTIGPPLGPLLLICKPQSLGGALLILVKRNWRVMLIPAGAILLSFTLWGFWPEQVAGLTPVNEVFNFSVLPIGIPYGIYLLWRAWHTDDEYLAAVSTPLLVPYITPYSLVSVLCVLASKYPKAANWFYFGIWAFTIIEYRRIHLS